jgi:hypothetical protein
MAAKRRKKHKNSTTGGQRDRGEAPIPLCLSVFVRASLIRFHSCPFAVIFCSFLRLFSFLSGVRPGLAQIRNNLRRERASHAGARIQDMLFR